MILQFWKDVVEDSEVRDLIWDKTSLTQGKQFMPTDQISMTHCTITIFFLATMGKILRQINISTLFCELFV